MKVVKQEKCIDPFQPFEESEHFVMNGPQKYSSLNLKSSKTVHCVAHSSNLLMQTTINIGVDFLPEDSLQKV